MPRRQPRVLLLACAICIVVYYTWRSDSRWSFVPPRAPTRPLAPGSTPSAADDADPAGVELVVAAMDGDDVAWLEDFFPDWARSVYVVDDATAPLTVPVNKGREAMAYLTYIIDRYDSLPPVSIFLHSLRYQWHNEDPMYDGVPPLRSLRLARVLARGFVALRCTWAIGCPAELQPLQPMQSNDDRFQNEVAYAHAFRALLPREPVPATVGAHCSSQFAASRDQIRRRPRADYEHIRDWLVDTKLGDQISGRVIEYSWHIIMGMDAIDCEPAGDCFCNTFGLCNLNCTASGCEKRWALPHYSSMPPGWPDVGPGTDGWPERGWAD